MTSFPAELTVLPQWVLWRYEVRKGKRTKIPYQIDGAPASSTKPATWTSYECAVAVLGIPAKRPYDGIGFVFSADDPYCGIDLDHFLDRGGEYELRAIDIIDALNSYAEYSPSKTGAHVIVRTQLPAGFVRQPGRVECYDSGRYFTVTGDQIAGTPDTIADWDGEALVDVLFPGGQERRVTLTPIRLAPPAPIVMDDKQLLDTAIRARNGSKFLELWNGGIAAYGSHSEADAALCAHLAWWTNGDAGRVDALFRQSGLMRDKWEQRPDYRAKTVERACALVGGSFTPAQRSA